MKTLKTLLAGLIVCIGISAHAVTTPEKHPTDQFWIGNSSTSTNKQLMFDWGLGASSNPSCYTDSSYNLTYNKNGFKLGDGANSVDKVITANNGAGSPPQILFNHSTSAWQFTNDGTTYTAFGAGSSTIAPNYILNPDAESATTGWATYSDAAGNTPVDGTGGTATGLTFSRSTSSPLAGIGSFSMVQTNSTNIQGKGVSYDFSIDSAFQAKPLSVTFQFNASSTFVAGDGITAPLNDGTTSTTAGNSDVEVFVYDKTNSQLLYVSPQVMTANGADNYTFKGTFQTASNSTSYRLIFHVAKSSANATGWTYKFDNVYVGPQTLVQGSPITDWVSYTPVSNWVSNTTMTGYWRRIGDTMQIQMGVALTGTPTSASLTVNLPPGYSIDTAKLTNTNQNHFGWGTASDIGVDSYPIYARYNNTTSVQFMISGKTSTYVDIPSNVTQSVPFSFGNGDTLLMFVEVPIAGWASTVQMSNDTDTRVVAAKYRSTQTTVNGGSLTVNFDTKIQDTHNAVSSGIFTAPVSGTYRVSSTTEWQNNGGSFTVGDTIGATILVNSVAKEKSYVRVMSTTSTFYSVTVSGNVTLTAGDTLAIQGNAGTSVCNTALSGTAANNWVSIERISGPASIAATETVAARYTTTSAFNLTSSFATVNYSTKDYDTHSAVSTGSGWTFTAPISGKYHIKGQVGTTDTNAGYSQEIEIRKNSTATSLYIAAVNSSSTGTILYTLVIDDTLSLAAGDTIDIQAKTTSPTIAATTTTGANFISITRVGN